MRLIDGDALMDVINRNCYPVQHDMTSIEPGMTCVGILQAVQEQPTIEPEPRWIPCSERLPEGNGDYLVTGRKGAVNKRKYEDGRWYGNWAVLAWMELPPAYKEDTDD